MKVNTIYNVTAELSRNGYALTIHEKPKTFASSPSLSSSTFTQTTQKSPPVNSSGGSLGGSTQATTPWGVVTLPPGISPEQLSEVLKQLPPPLGGIRVVQVDPK